MFFTRRPPSLTISMTQERTLSSTIPTEDAMDPKVGCPFFTQKMILSILPTIHDDKDLQNACADFGITVPETIDRIVFKTYLFPKNLDDFSNQCFDFIEAQLINFPEIKEHLYSPCHELGIDYRDLKAIHIFNSTRLFRRFFTYLWKYQRFSIFTHQEFRKICTQLGIAVPKTGENPALFKQRCLKYLRRLPALPTSDPTISLEDLINKDHELFYCLRRLSLRTRTVIADHPHVEHSSLAAPLDRAIRV